jgi:F-type H+-transporting ATPase subunit a
MIEANPLATSVAFQLGPVPVTVTVVTTWVIMALLVGGSALVSRRMEADPGRPQAVAELLVDTMAGQVEEVMRLDPRPYLPLIGTLFLLVLACNLAPVLPGVKAPTAHIETTGALALVVFLAVHVYGIRARGLRKYLAHYLEPNILLAPLNLLAELTRTLALMVRLFGNIMSHELVLAVMLSLAGLLLPIPIMALGLLIGAVQAYIFAVLSTVFLGAAVGSVEC